MAAQHSPAADRNKQPILDVLRQVLQPQGLALEIASGTGQHVAFFAAGLPGWTWQPSDADAAALPSISAWCDGAGLTNVRPAVRLDVLAPRWPDDARSDAGFDTAFDAVYCANMLHISARAACGGLMRGAARHLAADGMLVTYGPYLEEGVAPGAGNLAFDASLRSRDPEWGIPQLAQVRSEAADAGLALASRFEMPANNLLLVFRRTTPLPAP